MGLSGIKIIFFDLDDTLFPAEKIYPAALRASWKTWKRTQALSLPAFRDLYFEARARVKSLLKNGPSARHRVLYFKEMTEIAFQKTRPRLALDAWRAYQGALGRIRLDEKNVFPQLAKWFELGIITNQVTEWQLRKIMALDPANRLFRFVVTSEEVGVEKPHPRIFREACRKAGCRPNEALMVGDSMSADIRGALNAGMRAAFLNPRRATRQVSKNLLHIKRLADLLTWVA